MDEDGAAVWAVDSPDGSGPADSYHNLRRSCERPIGEERVDLRRPTAVRYGRGIAW